MTIRLAREFRAAEPFGSGHPLVAVTGDTDLDPAIPSAIREVFSEGLQALGARAPRAAAVMFRRTLEAIVEDRGSPAAKEALKKNLAAGLKQMVVDGSLDSSLGE